MEDEVVRIDRKSSIESEPRTLTFDQIHFAREAALYVVSTRSVEEAVTVFTEGLEPVASVARGPTMMDSGGDINSYFIDHLQFTRMRDTVSAPF